MHVVHPSTPINGNKMKESFEPTEKMEEVKLFGAFPSPFSYRVEWALKLKGVDYQYIEEDLTNKSPMLLKYNPVHKQIPVLVHDGNPIVEFMVILEYIEETWKQNPLFPENGHQRAMARFWAKFHEEKLRPAIFNFFRYDGKEQEKAMVKALQSLQILEEYGLKNKKFFGGDKIGFADIVIGWIANWLEAIEDVVGIKLVTHDAFPALHAWMKNFSNAPIIRDNLPSREGIFAYFKGRRESLLASREINNGPETLARSNGGI